MVQKKKKSKSSGENKGPAFGEGAVTIQHVDRSKGKKFKQHQNTEAKKPNRPLELHSPSRVEQIASGSVAITENDMQLSCPSMNYSQMVGPKENSIDLTVERPDYSDEAWGTENINYPKNDRNERKTTEPWGDTDYSKYPKKDRNERKAKSFNEPTNWRSGAAPKSWDGGEKSGDYSAFEAAYSEVCRQPNVTYVKVEEIEADLFAMPKEYSLAHCVAEDMNMGSGIAVQFRREFKDVDGLLDQRQKQGGVAFLQRENRYIYYLVTKPKSTGKPTYQSMFQSLKKWATLVEEHGVKKLAIPRLGCGLDRLEWHEVKFMIEYTFEKIDAKITVCNFQQNTADEGPTKWRNCKFVEDLKPIVEIDQGTIILYFASEDGKPTKEMEALDKKFNIMLKFRAARKQMGQYIETSAQNGNYILCGCIVRKTSTGLFSFNALQQCLMAIRKWNQKQKYEYVAFEAFEDSDRLLNYKILNLMRNTLRDVEIYVCLSHKM